jgi:hypothetical protein
VLEHSASLRVRSPLPLAWPFFLRLDGKYVLQPLELDRVQPDDACYCLQCRRLALFSILQPHHVLLNYQPRHLSVLPLGGV